MPIRRTIMGICLVVTGGSAGWAGVGTSALTAQASVNTNCTISSTVAIAFGNYNPVGTHLTSDLNASGAVTIACVKGTAPTIALNFGTQGSSGQRRLFDPTASDFLNYDLYQPPTTAAGAACNFPGTIKWGDGTLGTSIFNATAAPDKTARTYNICGTVAKGQNPAIGSSYADTVVITVSF